MPTKKTESQDWYEEGMSRPDIRLARKKSKLRKRALRGKAKAATKLSQIEAIEASEEGPDDAKARRDADLAAQASGAMAQGEDLAMQIPGGKLGTMSPQGYSPQAAAAGAAMGAATNLQSQLIAARRTASDAQSLERVAQNKQLTSAIISGLFDTAGKVAADVASAKILAG